MPSHAHLGCILSVRGGWSSFGLRVCPQIAVKYSTNTELKNTDFIEMAVRHGRFLQGLLPPSLPFDALQVIVSMAKHLG